MNNEKIGQITALAIASVISALAVKLIPSLWFVLPSMFTAGLLYALYKFWKQI